MEGEETKVRRGRRPDWLERKWKGEGGVPDPFLDYIRNVREAGEKESPDDDNEEESGYEEVHDLSLREEGGDRCEDLETYPGEPSTSQDIEVEVDVQVPEDSRDDSAPTIDDLLDSLEGPWKVVSRGKDGSVHLRGRGEPGAALVRMEDRLLTFDTGSMGRENSTLLEKALLDAADSLDIGLYRLGQSYKITIEV